MNNFFEMVKQVHQKFNCPVAEKPQMLEPARRDVRIGWIEKELIELRDAKRLVDQVDATFDIIYFCIGNLVEMGVKPEGIFEKVQDANLRKLWPDGTCHKTPEGKWIKPPDWYGPESEIKQIILWQMESCPYCKEILVHTNLGGGKMDTFCENCGFPDESRK